ncbi:MAG: T9SS type A sorting domain-containing protein, partial [Bacteroidota bacterium]
ATPYHNSCSSICSVPYYAGFNNKYYFLQPLDGSAYIQMYVYQTYQGQSYREFAQVKLIDTLENNKCYYVEFYAANSQWIKYRVNNISACFSSFAFQNFIPAPGIIPNVQAHIQNYGNPVLPDTVSWQKISGIYEALGDETYLALGNFKDNSNTDTVNIYKPGQVPYYTPKLSSIFIDAISVFSINPNGTLPWAYRDTTIIKGDSVYIGNKMGGLNFHPRWYDMSGNYLATNAGIFVRPAVTSSYVVQYTVCGTPRIDTVEVKVLPNVALKEWQMMSDQLHIFPQPAQQKIYLNFDNNKLMRFFEDFEIYNQLGVLQKQEKLLFENYPEHGASIDVHDLQSGIYFLRLKNMEGITINKKILVGD